jgi:hypothetical protein
MLHLRPGIIKRKTDFMNSKYVMVASAVLMGVLGLGANFFPNEILGHAGVETSGILALFIQLTGALYLGFAFMNWMAKTVLIGGIYARPLAIGNFTHFLVGALALVKAAMHFPASKYLWLAAIIYSLFAVLFGTIFFTNPAKR